MKETVLSEHDFPRFFSPELIVFEKGRGSRLTDRGGKEYLDFGAGIAVNALGHGNDDLADAAAAQMKKLIHVSNLYTTEPALELARRLKESGPFDAVFFGNSGSEANEAALKLSRLYAWRTRGEGHHRILSFSGAFHGRTLGALSCTHTPKYQEPFAPLVPGCEAASYNDSDELEKRLDPSFAAVIVEVIQGEGGLRTMTPPFADALNRLCREHDIMLIVDEVQTGLGRTGSLYAYSQVGLEPDIVTLAKPLAAGLPLSATLIPDRINRLLHIGEHGTTFGGGPVTTCVALKMWDVLSQGDFLAEVGKKGRYLNEQLQQMSDSHSIIGEIRGRGLLQGVEIEGRDVAEVMSLAREKGLLVLRSGENVLRLAPPLVITEDELAEGLAILNGIFEEMA